ncbi:hypothetical protein AVEN_268070-1 [Araneus ventricosus]|uniref:Protein kinase domain-containing protein n=1 Tax=Araneus ventricosus TaxID=182803 RepID=A0A4Y2KMR9_ARAVE|nr:hypothetical protein AVEN_268070-1 [Araneus ventricosus]
MMASPKQSIKSCGNTDGATSATMFAPSGMRAFKVKNPSYLAPEIRQGKPYAAIPADVWSTGVSMFAITNNSLPFTALDPEKIYQDQLSSNWDFLPNVKEKLSRSAKGVISRMLNPDPRKRPSMDDVIKSNWLKNKCHW